MAIESAPDPVDSSSPSEGRRARAADKDARSHALLMMVLRALFIVALISVFVLTVSAMRPENKPSAFQPALVIGLAIASAALGGIIILIDTLTPNKRLAWLVAIFVGSMMGLVGAVAIGFVLDLLVSVWGTDINGQPILGEEARAYIGLAKVTIGLVLIYLSISVVLTTRDDYRLVIPYVEFAKQTRGARPLLLDTSALVDGRVDEIAKTGIFDAPIIAAQFVVDELQALADSQDRQKRQRGRRGLDVLQRMQVNPFVDLEIEDLRTDGRSVDRALVEIARSERYRIVTTDSGLEKVAQINGVAVLNLNMLSVAARSGQTPGDAVRVHVLKRGENAGQGVGYLEDGTMVVIDDGAAFVGQHTSIIITNAVNTAAGRLLFGRPETAGDAAAPSNGEAPASAPATAASAPSAESASEPAPEDRSARLGSMARAATNQPRTPLRPGRADDEDGNRSRNPRR